MKYRTINFEIKSTFKKNEITNKNQLNTAVFKSIVESIVEEGKNIFEITYIYSAVPLSTNVNLKNNVNLKKRYF